MYPRSGFGRGSKTSGAGKFFCIWKVSRLMGKFPDCTEYFRNVSKKRFEMVFKISRYPNRIPVESCYIYELSSESVLRGMDNF